MQIYVHIVFYFYQLLHLDKEASYMLNLQVKFVGSLLVYFWQLDVLIGSDLECVTSSIPLLGLFFILRSKFNAREIYFTFGLQLL